MQELSSFHLVDPNSGEVMMIVMSDVWDVKKKDVWDNCVMTTLISNRNLKLCEGTWMIVMSDMWICIPHLITSDINIQKQKHTLLCYKIFQFFC